MKYSGIVFNFDFNFENPSFIRKIQNTISKPNSGISRIFDKIALQKEIENDDNYLY